jgi:arabinogalactan endo-1,4-beta-galactosidase
MLFRLALPFLITLSLACSKTENEQLPPSSLPPVDIRCNDASFIPEIRESGYTVKNAQGETEDMLAIMKDAGINTIRLRIWHTPANEHSGFQEVYDFANEIHDAGLKVMLTVHYSDHWVDPGKQNKPGAWANLGFDVLKDSVYEYTKFITACIKPEYIQIGNEINGGLLWPDGRIQNAAQMRALLSEGIRAVREFDPEIQIIMHYAGHQGAAWFFDQVKTLDYDIMGLSYYPIWHGRDTIALQNNMADLVNTHNRKILIAETAYPFTLGWNDYTNNIIGQEDQLLPGIPATPQGQKDFMRMIRNLGTHTDQYAGFCYWAGEWTAYRGPTANNGSAWENQAFWDFDRNALPVLDVFAE